jgi:dihydroflavonol-4-reductase
MALALVTGGAGFIGHHLVAQLLQQGDAVRVLDLAPPVRDDIDWIQGSVCEPAAVAAAMRGVEHVYHLAGIAHLWAADKDEFERVNHQGTRQLLTAAGRSGAECFVHSSTGAILLGPRRPDGRIDETSTADLAAMPGPYCRSKFLAEQAALTAAGRGQPVVVVNTTVPVGPGDDRLTPPTRMLRDFLRGRAPAYLETGLNLVDVRDVAAGHRLAAVRGRAGERYLLAGENLWLSELLAQLEQLSGVPMPRRRVPYPLAWSAAVISELVADHWTHRPPRAPLTGVRLARHALFAANDKANIELGWRPRPVREALAAAVAELLSLERTAAEPLSGGRARS